jgi:hypothetical protein
MALSGMNPRFTNEFYKHRRPELPVGTTRTLTCRSNASLIPAIRHTPRYTMRLRQKMLNRIAFSVFYPIYAVFQLM